MAKFAEAEARLFKNVYVCFRCKTKMRTNYERVKNKLVKCRRCGCKDFRPKNKTRAK